LTARRPFSDSGRKRNPRGSAPAGTPTGSLAGTPNAPRRSPDSLAGTPSARSAALALLGRRDYTTAEIRTRLIDRGYSETDADGAIAGLTASGLVDDRRVAAGYVRSATAVKGRGRIRIALELKARGLSRAVIDEALSAIGRSDESAAIRRILTRKKFPAKPSMLERRRMFQHLLRRGFQSDTIRQVLGGRGDDVDE
jgi:regulatory protein